jgi:DNA-directed DNA polymerase III PolC
MVLSLNSMAQNSGCWLKACLNFYRFSSAWAEDLDQLVNRKGIIVFAGSALTDPKTFDYIDINPRSVRKTKQAISLHKQTGKPIVLTSDNDYPGLEHRDRFLAWDDSKKMTPQHILDQGELREAFSELDDEIFAAALNNTEAVANLCSGNKLKAAPIINVAGDLSELVLKGKEYRISQGHIKDWTQEYQERLERELAMIKKKEYESYFIVVADLIVWAKQRMLVGPGRGSSAGSLVCYLLQITEVDPIIHKLIFERFIDINRSDLPDIDIDFNDKKRELVFEYLAEKYGSESVARIGSVNRLKPRSVIAHVSKKLGIPHGAAFSVTNVLVEHSSGSSLYGQGLRDTLKDTQPGRDFISKYPEASVMAELELHASHSGVHAAGVIVCNEPVVEYCTVRDGIAQIDKKDAEYLNLLKIDALGLRTLGVIEDSGVVTAQELYDLKLDDPEVFKIFNDQKFSGIFQFEGAAQRSVAIFIPVKSFEQIDHITALSRPGPLGGGATAHYTARYAGKEPVTYRHPSMENYLGDTFGLVLYQEQVMNVSRHIGRLSWEVVSDIRKAMSGSKGEEYFNRHGRDFIKGAAESGIPKDEAQIIWDEIVSFGAWGMNKAHTVSYSIISYWCAWMKRYHEIEYAAANLRNAKDDEQTMEILRELKTEGIEYVPFDPIKSEMNWVAADGKLVGGYTSLIGIGPVKAGYYINKRNQNGLDEKDLEKLKKHKPKITDLSPAHTMWNEYYEHPENFNIHGKVREFADLDKSESVVVIGHLIEVKRRDQNEAVLINKRNGKVYKGQTLFLDTFMVDDSVSKPIRCRVPTYLWKEKGEPLADKAVPKKDWFLIRGKWLPDFNMMSIEKIKCLTNKEVFG